MYNTLSGSAMSLTPVQQLSKYAYHELAQPDRAGGERRRRIAAATTAVTAPQRRHTRTQERRAGPVFPKNTTFYVCADTPTDEWRPARRRACAAAT